MIKLILLFILAPSIAYGQTINDIPIKDIDATYVQLVATGHPFSTKVTITLDFGQETKLFKSNDLVIRDNENKPIKFNSVIEALNFMASNGYYYIDSFPLSTGNSNVQHFLLGR